MNGDLSALSPKLDYAIGAAATTSPWWMPYFNDASHVLIVVGGLALLILRLAISWKEYRAKKRGE